MIGRCDFLSKRPIFRGDMLVLDIERYLRVLSKRINRAPVWIIDLDLNQDSFVRCNTTGNMKMSAYDLIISEWCSLWDTVFRMDHTKQRSNKNENEHKEYLKNIYILSSSYDHTYMMNVYITDIIFIIQVTIGGRGGSGGASGASSSKCPRDPPKPIRAPSSCGLSSMAETVPIGRPCPFCASWRRSNFLKWAA